MSQNLTEPKKGAMYLFDYVTPPLEPGPYRMEVSTTVGYDATTKVLDDKKYFDVVGPRFSLDASEVGTIDPRAIPGATGQARPFGARTAASAAAS